MPEIHVGLTEEATVTKTHDGIRMSLWIAPDAPAIDYERRQSPWFWLETIDTLRAQNTASAASHENPLRVPSGGAVSFFLDDSGERKHVSFCQKDAGAPRDPGFRVPRNGYPSSVDDWYTFNHLMRESFEEGIFITKSGNELLVPPVPEYRSIIEHTAANLESKTGLRISGTRDAHMIFRGGNDILEVYPGRKEEGLAPVLCERGVLTWTPESGPNFIKFLDVDYPVDELYFVDGEVFPNGNPIGRDVCLVDLKHLQGKRFGDFIEESVHSYDKKTGKVAIAPRTDRFYCERVLRAVLGQVLVDGMPVYPVPAINDAYEFLSSRAAQVEQGNLSYSTLERKLFEKRLKT